MTDHPDSLSDDTERLAEERRAALSSFAKATATALQGGALQFATQSEQLLVSSITALIATGLTVDDVAVRVGLRREYVEELLDGRRIALRFL